MVATWFNSRGRKTRSSHAAHPSSAFQAQPTSGAVVGVGRGLAGMEAGAFVPFFAVADGGVKQVHPCHKGHKG